MDAFFASVEQRDHPAYRNRPLVVGGQPDGRGVVAAASYEARRFGIHSAMPAATARRKCPHAVFVRPRFEIYRKISSEIRDIFHNYTDLVEPLSLDEAYLDVSHEPERPISATLIAQEIRQKIRSHTGLTASAGVSFNKFLAKIASDRKKPDGIFVILPEEADAFLESLEIGDFYGVGKATRRSMEQLGIHTGRDLKRMDEMELVRHFGKAGHHYYRIVRGVDNRPVKPHRIRKSVGKEKTFGEDIRSLQAMEQELRRIGERVAEQLNRIDASGRTITLKVRYDDFETVTRSSTLTASVSHVEPIVSRAVRLLDHTEAGDRSVRLLGITVSTLTLPDRPLGEQLEFPFLSTQETEKQDA